MTDAATDAAYAELEAAGWSIMDDDGFIHFVGPMWHRIVDGINEFAVLGQDKHRNRRGVVQGGAVMTLADRAAAWRRARLRGSRRSPRSRWILISSMPHGSAT